MKKLVLGACTVLLCTGLLFGCGKDNDEKDRNSSEESQGKEHNNIYP